MGRICIFFFSFSILNCSAQLFTGTGGGIINGQTETLFNLNVSGLSGVIDSVYGLEEVCININHPTVEELHVFLRSPTGIQVELSGIKSCKGTDFLNTCFNNSQPNSVSIGTAPHSGTFKPIGNLGRFNRQQQGNGTWQLIIKDFVSGSNSGTLNNWSLKFSGAPAHPVILISSNLPLVYINMTPGQSLSDIAKLGSFSITDNGSSRNYFTDPKNNYNGKATFNIRGSSSKMFEKHNLKVELKDAFGIYANPSSLCGMPVESDWILTACYTDKTMIRNSISQQIFRNMGHYTPRYKYVELILNDEYYGVYLLMEQIKRGKDRLAIDKITTLDNQFPNITGGYILEIDRTNVPGWYSLNPGVSANNAKFYYQYNYPTFSAITTQQKDYIKSVLDSFETVMASPSFTDPNTGYKKFIDENSFIDYLILNEVSKNVDAYKLSSYLYKDNVLAGGKLHFGPAWDYDLAWHNSNFGNAFSEQQWQYEHNNSSNPIPTWWKRLIEDPVFADKLYCRYHTLRQGLLSNNALFDFVDSAVILLEESRQRNFTQFPILGAYIWPNPQVQAGATYSTEIQDLKSWIVNRTAWLDINLPGYCTNVNVTENNLDKILNVYPNPFESRFNISYKTASGVDNTVVELYNMDGQRIVLLKEDYSANGIHNCVMNGKGLAEGIYLLKFTINGKTCYKKIVKAKET